MSYSFRIDPTAERGLRSVSREIYQRMREAILRLTINPRPPGCLKMKGRSGEWRIQVARHYRIRYLIDDAQHVVTITRAGHRRDVYDD